MPEIIPTTWAAIEPGMTVIGRDGRPRLIFDVQRWYDAHEAWVIVTDADGEHRLADDHPALVLSATMQEAVVELLVTFPGSEIIG
jgi:hypothetical protein